MKKVQKGMKRIKTESDERNECEILKVGQYRFRNNQIEYEVFWKGYPHEEVSWETIDNLQNCT